MTAASIWVTASDEAAQTDAAPRTMGQLATPATAPVEPFGLGGRGWERVRLAALADRLQAEPEVGVVLLDVPSAAAAAELLDPALSGALARALDEVAIVVLLRHADARAQAQADTNGELKLYAQGVQDVWSPADAIDPAAGGRLAAAVARKAAVRQARPAYATDPDTGLVNRAQLVEHLSHLLAVRAREPAPIGLVVLQLGQGQVLKGVLTTDQIGLARRKLAVRLRGSVRASDVVAALGHDLYAVMLSWVDTPADTRTVATKLGMALRHPLSLAGESVTVPVQVGWAVSPEDGDQPEALLRRALQRITTTAFNPRQAANDP